MSNCVNGYFDGLCAAEGRKPLGLLDELVAGQLAQGFDGHPEPLPLLGRAPEPGHLAAGEHDSRPAERGPHPLAQLGVGHEQLAVATRAEGVEVFSEIFADRAYLPDGQLVPRSRQGAVLHDADAIAERLIGFLESGAMPTIEGGTVALAAQSICVHSDTPGAVAIARGLRTRLTTAGVTIAPFL